MQFIIPVRWLNVRGIYSSIRLNGSQRQQSQFARHINLQFSDERDKFRKIQQFLDFPETFSGFSFQVELKARTL